jgi:flagellar motor switch protein FliG
MSFSKKLGSFLLLTQLMTFGSLVTVHSAEPAGSQDEYSDTVLRRKDLDKATLRQNALEALLSEKLRRVVKSAGVRPSDFQSAVTIHVVETIIPPEKRKNADEPDDDPKLNSKDKSKEKAKNRIPDFASFQDESLFSTSTLMKKYSDELKDEKERALAEADPDADNQDLLDDVDDPKVDYIVDNVYMHVSLTDQVSNELGDQVGTTLKNAFDPVFGAKLHFDVQRDVKHTPIWPQELFKWMSQFQNLAMFILAALAGLIALWMIKKIPSWQSQWTKRTAHEYIAKNEGATRHEEILTAPKEEPKEIIPEPPVADPTPSLEEIEREARRKIFKIEKKIVNFIKGRPYLPQRVLQDWGNLTETDQTLPKINLAVELFASHQVAVGKVEFRAELLDELRSSKKKLREMKLEDKIEVLEAIFWDVVSTEHLAHQSVPKTFGFLDVADDSVVASALQQETPETCALILVSLHEARASKIMSLLPGKNRREVMSHLFGAESAAQNISIARAKEISEKLKSKMDTIAVEQAAMGKIKGIEGFLPLLQTMDFESQYATSKGFLSLERSLLGRIFETYFNVGMLPAAKPEFLARIFIDRETNWIKTVLSQFSPEFKEKVRECLPPMQQRMLEGGNDTISRGAALDALAKLNDEILEKFKNGEMRSSDLFDADQDGQSGYDTNLETPTLDAA